MLRRAAVPDDKIALGAWPLPPLDSGPVELPYSDNINVLGVKAREVTELRDRVVSCFAREGFSMHEISGTCAQSTILGAEVGGQFGAQLGVQDLACFINMILQVGLAGARRDGRVMNPSGSLGLQPRPC